MRSLVAAATTTAFLATGCGADRPWPKMPSVIASQNFVSQGKVETIDVLPLDLAVWAEPGYDVNLDEVRSGAELNVMNVAIESLTKANYAINAMIDWSGNYPGGHAIDREDLLATVSSLARYGAAATEHPGTLPTPFLPARLGTTTGADATLYVGGWSYVTAPRESTGDKIGEAVVIGLLIISVVAIIAMVVGDSKSDSHSKSKSSKSHEGTRHASSTSGGSIVTGSHLGGSHGGGSHGGSHGGDAIHTAGGSHSGGHGGGSPVAFSAGRGVEHFHSHSGPSTAAAVVDAFGRTGFDIMLSTPDWVEDDDMPVEGAESEMYLEMTLIDNHTGLTLWHARQSFPANATSAKDTARVARTMMSKMPPRVLRTAAN